MNFIKIENYISLDILKSLNFSEITLFQTKASIQLISVF
jgi:hypothetical protein